MKLRLALYSDQIIPANAAVDRRLLELLGVDRPCVGYVSSTPDPARSYFSAKRKYYEQLGVELDHYVDEDNVGDATRIADLLACDAIHLTGGSTYRFLRWLQATDLLGALRKYALGGGVLIGTSAGSLLMTRDISIAQLSPDDASQGPPSLAALGLVGFQFWPHYQLGQELDPRAMSFLANASHVLACPDGSGVIVQDDSIDTIGHVKVFRYGKTDDRPAAAPR